MAKHSKKSARPPKRQIKQKTGFEKLVELKQSAKNKKAERINKYGPVNPQNKKETKIVTAEDLNKKISKKLKKKSLFDIESDEEEQVKHMRFVEEPDDLAKNAELLKKDEDINETRKFKQDRYKDMIKNSKKQKYEKSKLLEDQRETVEEMNSNFAKISEKLIYSTKDQVKKDSNDQFSSFYSILNNMKQQELLKATVIKKPKLEKDDKSEKLASEEDDNNNNFDEDSEEEINKNELRGYKQKQEVKGLENTLQNLKSILKNKRDTIEEEEEEYSDEDENDHYQSGDGIDDDDEEDQDY